MTTEEFSNEFDVLLNSYGASTLFGEASPREVLSLDEYEKSILLTQAQEEIVKELYTGRLTGESYEETERLKRGLSPLITTIEWTNGDHDNTETDYFILTPESLLFGHKDNRGIWYIIFEQAEVEEGDHTKLVRVVPMRLDEWHRAKHNPFRGPTRNRVIRVEGENGGFEIISKLSLNTYKMKYLRKPPPIILLNLPDGLTIDGVSDKTDCKLSTALHRTILERAVQLAYRGMPSK